MNETTVIVGAALLLAIGLALCTFLFITIKQELQQARQEAKKANHQLQDQVDLHRQDAERLQQKLSELEKSLEERMAEVPRVDAPKPGMNTSRRMQVLRMSRRGERPEQIAAALGIAQGEVDLLLKVHDIAQTA